MQLSVPRRAPAPAVKALRIGVADRALAPAPPSPEPSAAARPEVEALLARRARAVLHRDAAELAATAAPAHRAAQAELERRTARVPLAAWSYRVTGLDGGGDRLTADVRLDHRITGYDRHPATATRRLTLERSGGRWLLAADRPVGGALLWDLGTVRAVTGRHCLVLGLGTAAEAELLARAADRAVPAVSAVWGTGWAGRLLLYAPGSLDQLARLLDAGAADYQGIAAVTTASTGPSDTAPADRILVNPEAYRGLSDLGRQVVTTHEAVHVATRAATRPWTPLWLSEGAADWTAYLHTGRTAQQIAPELAADVTAGRLPRALPADAAFGTTATGLAQAYEQAWFACTLIARRHGPRALTTLYRTIAATGSADADRTTTVDRALRKVLGTGLAAFTADWRSQLAAELTTPTPSPRPAG
ncbi:hypothetical protein ACIQGZ_11195 [Streptomyces sp. NPDC092296]|uniref:hypothetical protein n=1 Tax=Streptomyces sp. NPDC092296 TaxID=3366012 RepID=UPI003803B676